MEAFIEFLHKTSYTISPSHKKFKVGKVDIQVEKTYKNASQPLFIPMGRGVFLLQASKLLRTPSETSYNLENV